MNVKKVSTLSASLASARRNPRPVLRVTLIVVAYLFVFLVLDSFSQQFQEFRGVVAWYPPAGLSYALLFVFGVRYAPLVAIASLVSSLFIYRMPQPPYALLLWALVVSSIYAVATAFLRHRVRFDWRLQKSRDVTGLVVMAVLVSALLAVLSVSSNALGSQIPRSEFVRAILLWWIGEMVGVLTVTPFLLVHVMPWVKSFAEGQPVVLSARRLFRRSTLSVVGSAFSLALALYWVFGARVLDEFRPLYLVALPLMWIALRRGLRGVTAGIVVLNFGVILAIWLFGFDLARLGELELLMIVICVVGLLLGAVVTERSRVEEELREAAQWLEESQRVAQLGHYIYDIEADRWTGSPALYEVLGVDESFARDFAGWLEIVHSEDRERLSRYFVEDVLGKREPFDIEYRIARPRDRIERWVHGLGNLEVRADGQVVSMFGIIQDITDHKLAEQMLRTSEKRFRDIADHAKEWIWEVDAEGAYTYASPVVESILGFTPEEILRKHFYDLFRPDDRETLKAAVLASIASRQTFREFLNCNVHKNGQTVWLSTSALPLLDDTGNLLGYRGVDTDITERLEAEEALRRRLAELEALHTVSGSLRTAETRDEAVPIVLGEMLAALETDTGVIWLYDPGSGELRPAVRRGWFESIALTPLRSGEGLVGAVFLSGQTHVSPELARDPLVPQPKRGLTPAGWGGICVPVRTGLIIIGVLLISVPPGHHITAHHVSLLESLAEMAGAALHRMSLSEETLRQLGQLQAMHLVDQAISSSTDLHMTLDLLLEHVSAQLEVDATDVLLLNPHTLTLEYAAGRGFRTTAAKRAHIRLGEGLAGRAALERRMVQSEDLGCAQESPRFAALQQVEGFAAYHVVPLTAKGQVLGVLEVFNRAPLAAAPDWLNLLETLAGQAAIAMENAQLFDHLQRSNVDLALAYDDTIEGWSHALDLRDKETEGHTQRVTEMTMRLARAMGIGDAELIHVRRGALLHDIGKMGVPDDILLKPGPLTEEEWVLMRRHPQLAYDLLAPITYLRPALDIPYCHHERLDGTGYPRGIQGEQIPLAARLFAVVDVWDALRHDRPYRKAWTKEKSLAHLRSSAGTQFDPRVVQEFLDIVNGRADILPIMLTRTDSRLMGLKARG